MNTSCLRKAQWVLPAAAWMLFVCSTMVTSSAQTLTTLVTFDGSNGVAPIPALVQGTDGNFYGISSTGGTNGGGTVFKITPQGAMTTIYDFCRLDGCGQEPMTALTLGTDGNFYGTTFIGGTYQYCNGTLFKITPQGTLTLLYSFCEQAIGQLPEGSLVQARDGNFYGTGYDGGSSNAGIVFRITPQGKLAVVHNFCSDHCADGAFPSGPGMILGMDGNLYGTTTENDLGYGTVFSINQSGQLSTLYTFCTQTNCADGRGPGPLVQAANGNFYGTTGLGGVGGLCQTIGGCGTVFQITPSGQFSTLYSFCQRLNGYFCPDGNNPNSLILGSDGNLYGTTQNGGIAKNVLYASGTIFRITQDGTLTTLYTFCTQSGCPDGAGPGNLVQSVDGSFFGATEGQTATGSGTIFRAKDGLPQFVQALPAFGKSGTSVLILGSDLIGATAVSFNGTPATFQVLSKQRIRATVPAGATTGTLSVVTTQGTLGTNLAFSIVP